MNVLGMSNGYAGDNGSLLFDIATRHISGHLKKVESPYWKKNTLHNLIIFY